MCSRDYEWQKIQFDFTWNSVFLLQDPIIDFFFMKHKHFYSLQPTVSNCKNATQVRLCFCTQLRETPTASGVTIASKNSSSLHRSGLWNSSVFQISMTEQWATRVSHPYRTWKRKAKNRNQCMIFSFREQIQFLRQKKKIWHMHR